MYLDTKAIAKVMSTKYQYIPKPSALFKYYSNEDIVSQNIEFVSLLTRITFNPLDSCTLFLQNFEQGKGNEPSYVARIPCKTHERNQLAKMVYILLMNSFDLALPDTRLESESNIENIHHSRLSFVRCKGLLTSSPAGNDIVLHEVIAIDLDRALETEYVKLKKLSAGDWSTINQIVDNLIKLDKAGSSGFRIEALMKGSKKIRDYIEYRINRLKLATLHVNPMFAVNRLLVTDESQDDFNSQREDPFNFTQPVSNIENSLDEHAEFGAYGKHEIVSDELPQGASESGMDAKERDAAQDPADLRPISELFYYHNKERPANRENSHSDGAAHLSSAEAVHQTFPEKNASKDAEAAPKHLAGRRTEEWHEEHVRPSQTEGSVCPPFDASLSRSTLSEFELHGVLELKTKVVGIRPSAYEEPQYESNTLLLYIPLDTDEDVKHWELNVNCVEIFSSALDSIFRSCGISTSTKQEALAELTRLLQINEVHIRIKKSKLFFTDIYYVHCWELEQLQLVTIHDPEPQPHSDKASNVNVISLQTKCAAICDITASMPSVTIFALLVCAKISKTSKVHHFSFTDFTENPNICCKIDPYINDYSVRLKATECMYLKAYPEFLVNFDSSTLKYYRRRLIDCSNGRDANLTNFGMVFRLKLDIKTYKDSINGIIREALLVTTDMTFSTTEATFLRRFYDRAFSRISHKCFYHNFKRYRVSFPIEESGQRVQGITKSEQPGPVPSAQPRPPANSIPDINLDVSTYTLRHIVDVTHFNSLHEKNPNELYFIRARILSITVDNSKAVIYITDDAPLNTEMVPYEVLKLEILGASNVEYFCGAHTQTLDDELNDLILRPFNFYLLQGKIHISLTKAILTWCPIECSLDDLKCQLQYANIKMEETSLTDDAPFSKNSL